jgi:peptide/nickel transport system substrate-binding protein/oligopeptide transport system substrate-binding protein
MRSPILLTLACSASLALTGCHAHERDAIPVVVIGTAKDLSAVHSPAGRLLRGATSAGLVALDEDGHVVPALADRWIVTDNGLTYIFRLRNGSWADGTPITGEAVRSGLHQTLSALRGSALGLDLAGIEDVRLMAGRVVEIRLAAPLPDLLQLLAQPELALARRRGAGPMLAKRDGEDVALDPVAPEKLGLPAVDDWAALAHRLRLTARPGADAIAAFAAGSADIVLGGSFADLPPPQRLALARSRPRLDPVAGLFGLAVGNSDGPLATPELREALAMAIDRDGIGTALALPGWVPTTRLVAPGSDGDSGQIGERWAGQPLAQRRQAAAARIAKYLHGRHLPAAIVPTLTIALPAGPGADALFAGLARDLAAVGFKVTRVAEGEDADLRLVDTVARYTRPAWYLNQLSCPALRAAAREAPCSPAADALTAQARMTTEPAAAMALEAQAEAALTKANIFIPLGNPLRWSLVRSEGAGFAINRWNAHPLLPLAINGAGTGRQF